MTSTVSALSPATRRLDAFAVVRFCLLLATLGALAALPFVAIREVPFDELTRDAHAHPGLVVDAQGLLPAGATGASSVTLTWRAGLFRERTTVEQRNDGSEDGGSVTRPQFNSDLDAFLARQTGTTVLVNERSSVNSSSEWNAPLDWRVPSSIGAVYPALFLVGLLVLVSSPPPWRATRWAWFWLLANPAWPLTVVAYCVLAGPTPGIPAPRPDSRKLTGGWAWIIAGLGSGAAVEAINALISAAR